MHSLNREYQKDIKIHWENFWMVFFKFYFISVIKLKYQNWNRPNPFFRKISWILLESLSKFCFWVIFSTWFWIAPWCNTANTEIYWTTHKTVEDNGHKISCLKETYSYLLSNPSCRVNAWCKHIHKFTRWYSSNYVWLRLYFQ